MQISLAYDTRSMYIAYCRKACFIACFNLVKIIEKSRIYLIDTWHTLQTTLQLMTSTNNILQAAFGNYSSNFVYKCVDCSLFTTYCLLTCFLHNQKKKLFQHTAFLALNEFIVDFGYSVSWK